MTEQILSDEQRAAAHARQQRRYRDQQALKQYDEREHLRSEIPSRQLVGDILTVKDMLLRGREEVRTPSGEILSQELARTRQNGLKAAADIAFKLLNKTVPDLKQIELRADVTEEVLPQAVTYRVVHPIAEAEIDD